MQGKNHVALATCGISAYSLIMGWPGLLPTAGLLIGSLGPDIDGGGAIARPSTFIPRTFPKWLLDGTDWVGLRVSKLIKHTFGHRGALHWPLVGLAMMGAGYSLQSTFLLWFGAGWLMHLVGDIITVEGVPLFGPLSRRKVSLFPMRVGSRTETIVALACWVGTVSFILANYVDKQTLDNLWLYFNATHSNGFRN